MLDKEDRDGWINIEQSSRYRLPGGARDAVVAAAGHPPNPDSRTPQEETDGRTMKGDLCREWWAGVRELGAVLDKRESSAEDHEWCLNLLGAWNAQYDALRDLLENQDTVGLE
jgi:hypothetical protein